MMPLLTKIKRIPLKEASLLVLLFALTGMILFLTLSDKGQKHLDAMRDGFYQATAKAGFKVEHVLVEGRKKTRAEDLMRRLSIKKGVPILSLDLDAMSRTLSEELEWAETVIIERRLPDTLYIRLEEAQPRAIWSHQNRLFVISHTGEAIESEWHEKYTGLPFVKGADAPSKLDEYLTMLSTHPDLAPHIIAAERIGKRRWNLTMQNGILIKLPEAAPAVAVAKLADLQKRENILGKRISIIDLRLPDRAFVQTYPVKPARKPDVKSENI